MTAMIQPKVLSLDLIKIKCPECRRFFKNKNAVNNHLRKSHDVSYKIDLDSRGFAYLRNTVRITKTTL